MEFNGFVVSTEFHEVGIDVDRMPASGNDPPRCVPADARGCSSKNLYRNYLTVKGIAMKNGPQPAIKPVRATISTRE